MTVQMKVIEQYFPMVLCMVILRLCFQFVTWGPFLEGPEKFSDPESHNKNLQP